MLLYHVPVVDSTNTYVRKHWEILQDRTCVYCDVQDAGRGRYGRSWLTDTGMLPLSFVLKRQGYIDAPLYNWMALTHYAALVLCRVLRKYDLDAQIKWPNDVLVGNKKIAGILAEGIIVEPAIASLALTDTAIPSENFAGIVLGIGINVTLSDALLESIAALGGHEATSIEQCGRPDVERNVFLSAYTESFFEHFDSFMKQGFSYIYDEYSIFSYSLHRKVTINTPVLRLTGMAKTFTMQGELILVDSTGREYTFNSGELL